MPIQYNSVGCSACTTNQSIPEHRNGIAGFWVLCQQHATAFFALPEIIAILSLFM
jgi:hypothetical protein